MKYLSVFILSLVFAFNLTGQTIRTDTDSITFDSIIWSSDGMLALPTYSIPDNDTIDDIPAVSRFIAKEGILYYAKDQTRGVYSCRVKVTANSYMVHIENLITGDIVSYEVVSAYYPVYIDNEVDDRFRAIVISATMAGYDTEYFTHIIEIEFLPDETTITSVEINTVGAAGFSTSSLLGTVRFTNLTTFN